jgi:dienelactone hydrolase
MKKRSHLKSTISARWFSLCLILLSSCATIPSAIERRAAAESQGARQGWQLIQIPAERFELIAFVPTLLKPSRHLAIYFEGDGFAWVNGTQVSTDPTPNNPLALRLALAQPEGSAAYLSRPCQYVDAEISACSRRYWTDLRFSPEVIEASDRAVEVLKEKFTAKNLTFVGYSGGAAVAVLVAARRKDVVQIITVAGNLDHRAWTAYHHLSPLTGSQNPIDERERLQPIRQFHFAGGKDTLIPPSLVESYADRFLEKSQRTVHVEPTFDHHCCWVEKWPRLWRKATSGEF